VRLEKKKERDRGHTKRWWSTKLSIALWMCCYEMASLPQLTSICWWRGPL